VKASQASSNGVAGGVGAVELVVLLEAIVCRR
jgi:hypothetical protein